MTLADTIRSEDEQTSPEHAAIEAYVPKANQPSPPAPILSRKGQRLDVDGVLARSLPSIGAYSAPEVKTRVSR